MVRESEYEGGSRDGDEGNGRGGGGGGGGEEEDDGKAATGPPLRLN
jgi:hypothetical protein